MLSLLLLLQTPAVTCTEPCVIRIDQGNPIVVSSSILCDYLPCSVNVTPVTPPPEPEPAPAPSADIVLTGHHTEQWKRVGLSAGTVIDASAASFYLNNCKNSAPTTGTPCSSGSIPINPVPVLIEQSPGVVFRGGRFDGIVPQDYAWSPGYSYDSSALRILESPGAVIRDVRIEKAWDAIRIRINSNNFTIENVLIEQARDDAIENDYRHSATIRNVLVDGALSCIALSPPSGSTGTDGTGQTLRLENFHCRLAILNQDGDMTHGSPFKAGDDGKDLAVVANNVTLAMMDATPNGGSRLRAQMERFTCEASCTLLNLSSTPLGSSHTWRISRPNTVLIEGDAAWVKWNEVEIAWRNANPALAN